MRDTDDPLNPFRGMYADWDYWLVAHATEFDRDRDTAYGKGEFPENTAYELYVVDAEGFPIPSLLSLENYLRENSCQYPEDETCTLHFFVFGEMPMEMWERYQDARMRIRARYAAIVPAWLAENPPICTRIWPDGTVTTHGVLGSWDGKSDIVILDDNRWTYTSEPYYLYSPDGELIRQTEEKGREEGLFDGDLQPDDVLEQLFFKDWMEKAFQRIYARGWKGMMIDYEYYYAVDRDWNITEVYDLDGTRYGPDFDLRSRDANKFEVMYGDYIMDLYKYQQELGVSEAAAP